MTIQKNFYLVYNWIKNSLVTLPSKALPASITLVINVLSSRSFINLFLWQTEEYRLEVLSYCFNT